MRAVSLTTCLSILAVGLVLARPSAAVAESEPSKYRSPMRVECDAELAKDKKWAAERRLAVEREWSLKWHEREYGAFVTNKNHVIAAYASILVLLALFVLVLFTRHRRLMAEIEELRDEVKRAAADG